ncbi:kinase-like domain-containing protein [Biscogniauxia marginata]|nr:kinase-like domain-containing protein [Biscogniauxia marginata]
MCAFVARDHSPDGLGGEAGINPQEEHLVFNGKPVSVKELEEKLNIIQGKGYLLGRAVQQHQTAGKRWRSRAQIYERLGTHPQLVQLRHWDPVDHALTLEYMPHGNLKESIKKYGQKISPDQRRQWVMEATEGVELLHSHGVIQGDVGLHNFLLDVDLSLKIYDFGGSSLDGSRATVAPGVKYRLPSLVGKHIQPATIKEDLFALGSTIYFIATGHEPYNKLTDEDQEAESAKTIIELIRHSSTKVIPDTQ